jgi:hypothetical protein
MEIIKLWTFALIFLVIIIFNLPAADIQLKGNQIIW